MRTWKFALLVGLVAQAGLAQAQYTVNTLGVFDGTNGTFPLGGVIADASGNLYGTTSGNVNYGSYGTIYQVAAGTGALTTLYTFSNTDGAGPQGTLIADSAGNLYGTTRYGGVNNDGTVFEFTHDTHQIITLGTFNGSNGSQPLAGLVMDAQGNLFGTASSGGGPQLSGTVFEIPHGTNTINVLATFIGTNGQEPTSTMLLDSSGNLYGTTYYGGLHNQGSVFEVAAGTHALSTIVSFNSTNGAMPVGGLTADAQGNLYGTTQLFTTATNTLISGSVYELAAGTHALTTLATFDNSGVNGVNPNSTPIFDAAGNLYGTTTYGGGYDFGAIYQVATGTHTLSAIVSFNGHNGEVPSGPLIFGPDGKLTGTTQYGGSTGAYYGPGTVFEITHVPEASTLSLAAVAAMLSLIGRRFGERCVRRQISSDCQMHDHHVIQPA